MSDFQFTITVPSATVEQFLDALAERLADPDVSRTRDDDAGDRWLDSKAAADHLGITREALYKRTRRGLIPATQESRGGKLFFRRSDLDRWRDEHSNGA